MDIEKIIQQMTLEEKADFCSGSDFWHTQPVERLGVPAVMMSDGPSGLRKQDEQGDHLGINESIPAVCSRPVRRWLPALIRLWQKSWARRWATSAAPRSWRCCWAPA